MLELSSRGKQRGGGGITFSKTSGPLVKPGQARPPGGRRPADEGHAAGVTLNRSHMSSERVCL